MRTLFPRTFQTGGLMLTLTATQRSRHTGFDRRDFLRIGSLALGSMALPGLLLARASSRSGPARQGSVGRPSFLARRAVADRNLRPEDDRSCRNPQHHWRSADDGCPASPLAAPFPSLAELADKFAIVRSFASGNSDHQNYVTVAGGDTPLKVPMGTLYARVVGRQSAAHRHAHQRHSPSRSGRPRSEAADQFRNAVAAKTGQRQPAARRNVRHVRRQRRRRTAQEPGIEVCRATASTIAAAC